LFDALGIVHGRILLVLDEYHTCYARKEGTADEFMAQVSCLVNNTGGDTVVFVAGSSVYLRNLCFGEAPNPLPEQKFPSYQGKVANLNSKRTGVRSLGPSASRTEIARYLQSVSSPVAAAIAEDPRELETFFLATGGIRRSINAYLHAWNCRCFAELPNEHREEIEGRFELGALRSKYASLWTLSSHPRTHWQGNATNAMDNILAHLASLQSASSL
jgi:hypothetical protein